MSLLNELAQYRYDPLGFVLNAFPWGRVSELSGENTRHPFKWQLRLLKRLTDQLQEKQGQSNRIVQFARTSGHGIGKSSLSSWLTLWAVLTSPCKGVVTANTEAQLKQKTWAELAKWVRLCKYKSLIRYTATAIMAADPGLEKEWRIDQVPWSERNTEAFAGLHNQGKRVFISFDEASGIPDIIWEVAEGALTDQDTDIIWVVFGNPTRNTGRFRECFGKHRDLWDRDRIDSREVPITNKERIEIWRKTYGEDSDFFKVRVRGEFPSCDPNQFIPLDAIQAAMQSSIPPSKTWPAILGIDPACATNGDRAVFTVRRHNRQIYQHAIRGADPQQIATEALKIIREFNVKAVVVDADGIGYGVWAILSKLWTGPVMAFHGGQPAYNKEEYHNRRAEVYGELRKMLLVGMDLIEDQELFDELVAITRKPGGIIQLEPKENMLRKGLPSPDKADALAYTFAVDLLPELQEDDYGRRRDTTRIGGY